ncbi:M48 family metallopeptidase [Noviherbaspirillum aridicola]|uniref:Zn-dependent protease n=1 Tax=Noviherbaspirillum aridicola TaxID=2849687 RepID=A0ABQ4Q1N6_9BURK|nr:M48 family metallopeptidase [Noviherbaspirillum aridicola]GIZ50710.1 Zn-dependent protease [Noviherbaspirillum aridicola]
MNFFAQQEHARRQTRKLVVLFALAVLAIVAAVNAVVALAWSWTQTGAVFGIRDWPRGFFATNTGVTLALIGVGTLIEMLNLRDGGDAVAKMAGGRQVPPSSTDLLERRLLNVVEEMAIASGIAVPRVYLLDRETAINAFAAGYNPDEAVVAVTRGALTRLTRDELQGVIGHEFSHILNGDMRLNIRLIGLLAGLQMIAGFGRHLIDFGSHSWSGREERRKQGSLRVVLVLTGFGMLVVGYIGVFFGRVIKAAVSRQREFLADASAVQFTRNADGLGNALRKIAGLSRSIQPGSRIEHPSAEQLSHLFLGAASGSLAAGWLATHPPVEERLRRIYGRSMTPLDAAEMPAPAARQETLPDIPYEATGFAAASVMERPRLGDPAVLPADVDAALRQPQSACDIVHALLLEQGAARAAQLATLSPARARMAEYLADKIAGLPQSARLPLLDLAMPALRELDAARRAQLLASVAGLIAADRRVTLVEFVIQTVLARRLSPRAARPVPVRHHDLSGIRDACRVLLSMVVHLASAGGDAGARFAAGAARLPQAGLSSELALPVAELGFPRVNEALEQVHRLAPLAKPLLIKALLAAAGEPLPPQAADLLRAICAAIEAPVPEAVSASYPRFHWKS